ncbi:MAG: UDP-N-acetylglucosamine 1-carboxyvinyltransferase [Actinomycetota bacterium]|nr:UDP-N-acetylglucosamine 1-carboxyvinyltransferase [Actinomycetota bacterium]
MDKGSRFVVEGGNRLSGRIKVGGAKNSALKLMAAALLTEETTILTNVPIINDVKTMAAVLERLGARVAYSEPGVVEIKPTYPLYPEAPYELVSQMRASIIVLGPLLARLGKARVAMPGGCNIGLRKIDMHIRGLEAFGARFEVGHGFIEAYSEKLVAAKIALDYPSVGATENLLMAATLAEGETVIDNAAREPEIVDLADFLNMMGAKIKGAGSSTIVVEGVNKLHGGEYRVMPDRIEAGTFLVAAAITKGDVVLEDVCPEHLELAVNKLRSIGAIVKVGENEIRVIGRDIIRPADLATLPYPGFPTDLQTQFMTILAIAEGTSIITENIFENRFMFVAELNRMGSDIKTEGRHAIIRGVSGLSGAPVNAPDLRGGAALVVAGLVAEGVTEIADIYHIDRGYHNFEQKLRAIGASIERVSDTDRSTRLKIVR